MLWRLPLSSCLFDQMMTRVSTMQIHRVSTAVGATQSLPKIRFQRQIPQSASLPPHGVQRQQEEEEQVVLKP